MKILMKESSNAIKLSSEDKRALSTFYFWLNEGKKQGIVSISELLDHVITRTRDNPRGSNYGNKFPQAEFDILTGIADKFTSVADLVSAARKAYTGVPEWSDDSDVEKAERDYLSRIRRHVRNNSCKKSINLRNIVRGLRAESQLDYEAICDATLHDNIIKFLDDNFDAPSNLYDRVERGLAELEANVPQGANVSFTFSWEIIAAYTTSYHTRDTYGPYETWKVGVKTIDGNPPRDYGLEDGVGGCGLNKDESECIKDCYELYYLVKDHQ